MNEFDRGRKEKVGTLELPRCQGWKRRMRRNCWRECAKSMVPLMGLKPVTVLVTEASWSLFAAQVASHWNFPEYDSGNIYIYSSITGIYSLLNGCYVRSKQWASLVVAVFADSCTLTCRVRKNKKKS